MDGKTILNLAAAIRSRIAPGDDFDLYIPEREPKTTNFDEEELEILSAWKAGKLRPVEDVLQQLESHCSSTEATLKITLDPSKRGGSPCIRGLQITVYEVLSMLSKGVSYQQVLEEYPGLTEEDIYAVFAYAADQEYRV
jgi:uncharacterized protein (DUF433 family)